MTGSPSANFVPLPFFVEDPTADKKASEQKERSKPAPVPAGPAVATSFDSPKKMEPTAAALPTDFFSSMNFGAGPALFGPSSGTKAEAPLSESPWESKQAASQVTWQPGASASPPLPATANVLPALRRGSSDSHRSHVSETLSNRSFTASSFVVEPTLAPFTLDTAGKACARCARVNEALANFCSRCGAQVASPVESPAESQIFSVDESNVVTSETIANEAFHLPERFQALSLDGLARKPSEPAATLGVAAGATAVGAVTTGIATESVAEKAASQIHPVFAFGPTGTYALTFPTLQTRFSPTGEPINSYHPGQIYSGVVHGLPQFKEFREDSLSGLSRDELARKIADLDASDGPLIYGLLEALAKGQLEKGALFKLLPFELRSPPSTADSRVVDTLILRGDLAAAMNAAGAQGAWAHALLLSWLSGRVEEAAQAFASSQQAASVRLLLLFLAKADTITLIKELNSLEEAELAGSWMEIALGFFSNQDQRTDTNELFTVLGDLLISCGENEGGLACYLLGKNQDKFATSASTRLVEVYEAVLKQDDASFSLASLLPIKLSRIASLCEAGFLDEGKERLQEIKQVSEPHLQALADELKSRLYGSGPVSFEHNATREKAVESRESLSYSTPVGGFDPFGPSAVHSAPPPAPVQEETRPPWAVSEPAITQFSSAQEPMHPFTTQDPTAGQFKPFSPPAAPSSSAFDPAFASERVALEPFEPFAPQAPGQGQFTQAPNHQPLSAQDHLQEPFNAQPLPKQPFAQQAGFLPPQEHFKPFDLSEQHRPFKPQEPVFVSFDQHQQLHSQEQFNEPFMPQPEQQLKPLEPSAQFRPQELFKQQQEPSQQFMPQQHFQAPEQTQPQQPFQPGPFQQQPEQPVQQPQQQFQPLQEPKTSSFGQEPWNPSNQFATAAPFAHSTQQAAAEQSAPTSPNFGTCGPFNPAQPQTGQFGIFTTPGQPSGPAQTESQTFPPNQFSMSGTQHFPQQQFSPQTEQQQSFPPQNQQQFIPQQQEQFQPSGQITQQVEDPFGLSTTTTKASGEQVASAPAAASNQAAVATAAAGDSDTGSKGSLLGGLLGGLFRRKQNASSPALSAASSSGGPVQAKLGESEMKLVYDEAKKQWVRKDTGEAPVAAVVAPPSPPVASQSMSDLTANSSPISYRRGQAGGARGRYVDAFGGEAASAAPSAAATSGLIPTPSFTNLAAPTDQAFYQPPPSPVPQAANHFQEQGFAQHSLNQFQDANKQGFGQQSQPTFEQPFQPAAFNQQQQPFAQSATQPFSPAQPQPQQQFQGQQYPQQQYSGQSTPTQQQPQQQFQGQQQQFNGQQQPFYSNPPQQTQQQQPPWMSQPVGQPASGQSYGQQQSHQPFYYQQ